MIKSRKIISIIIAVVFIIPFALVFAFGFPNFFLGSSNLNNAEIFMETYDPSDDSVSINNLSIVATAKQDRSIDVVEDFDVTFNEGGLSEVIRYIPYAGYMYRTINGSVSKETYFAKITNASGSGEHGEVFNTYIDEVAGYITFGLGVTDKLYYTNTETRHFQISYTYQFAKDRNVGFDDIYFNIVGTNSLLTISNVSFDITYPSDSVNVNVYYGKDGENKNLTSVIENGNNITGTCSKLDPLEGITFRATYQDNKLGGAIVKVSTFSIITLIIGVVSVGLSIFCFLKFKQREDIVKPVELIAPEGLTPLKAEFYDKKKIDSKGISATVVYLASKGYIKIKENGDDIELIRIKNIKDDEDNNVKSIYKSLFPLDEDDKRKDSVNLKLLPHDFAESSVRVITKEKSKLEKDYYDKQSAKFDKIFKFIFAVLIFAIEYAFGAVVNSYFGFNSTIYNFQIIVLGIIFGLEVVVMFINKGWWLNCVASLLMLTALLVLYLKLSFAFFDPYYIAFIGIMLFSLSSILLAFPIKLNKEKAMLKGRVLGFKNFIEKCEVSQIKMFAKENPSYYFDVLPYAYVFGLSEVWMNKLKELEVVYPDWFITDSGVVDIIIFNSMFNTFDRRITSSLHSVQMASSIPSSFSGGGFSGGFGGGGFSGGGGGGGGFGAR